jgi:hypothetical protein
VGGSTVHSEAFLRSTLLRFFVYSCIAISSQLVALRNPLNDKKTWNELHPKTSIKPGK